MLDSEGIRNEKRNEKNRVDAEGGSETKKK